MRERSQTSDQLDHKYTTRSSTVSKNASLRKPSEDYSSILFEEESMIERNQSYEFLYQKPEIPPKVIGKIRKCYKICSCMTSDLMMLLDYHSVRFFQKNAEKFDRPKQLISTNNLKQVRSYKKKNFYFIRLIIKNSNPIDLKFQNKDICKQWIGYFNQVLDFHEYLIQREHYSNKDTFNQFMKSIQSQNHGKIVKLNDKTIVKNNQHQVCDDTTIIRKRIQIVRLADFKVTHRIGKGAFSTVYKAQKDGKIYAIKQMNKDQLLYRNQLKYALTQLNALKTVRQCPFTVQLYYAFQTQDYLYLAMQYLNSGNLQQYLQIRGKLSYKESLFIIQQLIVAVQYIHQKNILYRDLKPENIMLTPQGHIMLIDFGLSKMLDSRQQFAQTFVGSPLYIVPERLDGDGRINYKGDIYGVGCIFYTLLHGKTPFQGQSLQSIMLNIKNQSINIRKDINPLAQSFLKQTLEKNPQKRLSHMSGHPLFEDTNWSKVQRKQIKSPLQIKQKKSVDYVGIKNINDNDYTQRNYPSKKVNDWNFTIKI